MWKSEKIQLYWSVSGEFFDQRIKTGELRRLGSHCVFCANSADKSGSSKFWMKTRNVKEQKILGRRSFLGGFRNWGPAYLTCKLSICWEGTQLGTHAHREPLCPHLYYILLCFLSKIYFVQRKTRPLFLPNLIFFLRALS